MKTEMQPAPSSAVGALPPGTAVVYVPVQAGSKIFEHYKHKQSIGLGITQIIIGILCIVFNSVALGVSIISGLSFTGHGYWCGILFMITGIFGIIAGKKRTGCQIVTFMVLCIISAVFTIVVLIFGIIGALLSCFYSCNTRTDYYASVAMASGLAILGFIEAIVAIWGSTLCCRSGVCSCCSSPTVAIPAVGYFPNTGQMIHMTQVQGGPHVYAPQPSFSYPQGQNPPSVYVQPGCAMPSTSIGPIFDQAPPPYTTTLEYSACSNQLGPIGCSGSSPRSSSKSDEGECLELMKNREHDEDIVKTRFPEKE